MDRLLIYIYDLSIYIASTAAVRHARASACRAVTRELWWSVSVVRSALASRLSLSCGDLRMDLRHTEFRSFGVCPNRSELTGDRARPAMMYVNCNCTPLARSV